MKVKISNPRHPLLFVQMGVTEQRMDDLFTVLETTIDNHAKAKSPRSVILQDIANICDTQEELLSVLDVFYSYLHENDWMYSFDY